MADRFTDVHQRIQELREMAKQENEPFSETSCEMLLSFLKEFDWDIRPGIFLLANGNLRVLWDNEERQQIGIQMIPVGDPRLDPGLQYVVFIEGGKDPLRVAGWEIHGEMFRRLITHLFLDKLWYTNPLKLVETTS